MELSRAKTVTTNERKWSELPQDLIELIAQFLTTAQDFCRFGVVCTSWNKAAIQPNYNPISHHQLPWFIIPSVADELSSKSTNFNKYCFYDPCTSRSHELQYSSAMPVQIIGAGNGWVAIYELHGKKVVLLNPLRKIEIGLLLPFTSDINMSHMNVVLSGSPRGSISKVLIHYAEEDLIPQFMAHLLYLSRGDPQWRRINGANDEILSLYDFTFFKGRLYAFHATDETLVVVNEEESEPLVGSDQPDLMFRDVLKLPAHIRLTENQAHYLVSGGENLLVCVSTEHEPGIRYSGSEKQWTWDWKVYRVDITTKDSNGGKEKAEVVKMDGLGDGALFFSDKSSHYVSKLPSGGDCKLKRNSIYFHSDCFSGEKKRIIWETSFEDGTTKPFYTNEKDTNHIPSVWFVPRLWFIGN